MTETTTTSRGRKPMTEAEKKEKERVDAFDFTALEVEDHAPLAQVRKESKPNAMQPIMEALIEKGYDSKGLSETKAVPAPDEAVAKRVKSMLTSAAETLNVGVKIKILPVKTNAEGKPVGKARRVVFAVRKDRKSYNRSKSTTEAPVQENASE